MEEKVFFKNSKGNNLCGIISKPSSSKNRLVMILCHGLSSNKNSRTNLALTEKLGKHKISSFRFDLYGHGESEGKFENLTVSEAVNDILQAIKFLKAKGGKKIGLVGSSFSGSASLIVASKTKDLSFLALKSPVSDYEEVEEKRKKKKGLEEWKRRSYNYYDSGDGRKLKLNYTFFEDFKNNNGYKVARKIKIPTLIVHGDADEVVPFKQSVKISKLISNCKLYRIKGAGHDYSNPRHREEMLQAVVNFIIEKI